MSDSRSSTTVNIAAGCSTHALPAPPRPASADRPSRSPRGRLLCGIGLTPSRVQIRPPTKPRQAPLARRRRRSSNATSRPYALPFFTGPSSRRRCAVVGNVTPQVSSIASTCRPAQAAPVWRLQPGDDLRRGLPSRWQRTASAPQFAGAVAAQPTQADRLAARPSLRGSQPPLYRGADHRMSPSDQSMAASCLSQLPRQTQAHPPRVAPITFRFPDYFQVCPSMFKTVLLARSARIGKVRMWASRGRRMTTGTSPPVRPSRTWGRTKPVARDPDHPTVPALRRSCCRPGRSDRHDNPPTTLRLSKSDDSALHVGPKQRPLLTQRVNLKPV